MWLRVIFLCQAKSIDPLEGSPWRLFQPQCQLYAAAKTTAQRGKECHVRIAARQDHCSPSQPNGQLVEFAI